MSYKQPLVPTGGADSSTGVPAPGTTEPIRNPDGSVTTERSITVTDPRLNGGAATNIPSVWGGRIVSDDDAIDNAMRSGMPWQSFPSIKRAEQAARQRSNDLGTGRATSIPARPSCPIRSSTRLQPNLSPDLVNAATGLNRSLTNGLAGQQDQYRQPLSMTTLDQSQAPTWQDDQDTRAGYVTPDMAPGPPIPGHDRHVAVLTPDHERPVSGASPAAPAVVPPAGRRHTPGRQHGRVEHCQRRPERHQLQHAAGDIGGAIGSRRRFPKRGSSAPPRPRNDRQQIDQQAAD